MGIFYRNIGLAFFISIVYIAVHAQDMDAFHTLPVSIRNIKITGNRQTKSYIIQREIPMKIGKAYPMAFILSGMNRAKNNLMNTSLFISVSIDFTNWLNDSLDLVVDVKERWYWIPLPFVRPIDRNLNVWLKQHRLSINRVDYGFRLNGRNLSGRNDDVLLSVANGYTRKFGLSYRNPFSDNNLRHGFGVEVSHSDNKEVNVMTNNNNQVFYKNPLQYIRTQTSFGGVYSYRKGSIQRHYVKLLYHFDRINDSIVKLNPNFFGNGITSLSYPEISYRYQYLGVDYIPYALTGLKWEFNFLKRGFGGPLDLWQFRTRVAKYWKLNSSLYLSSEANMMIKLPFKQAFINQSYMGYQDNYLRGLEYSVIDGVMGGFLRNTLRRHILDFKLNTGVKNPAYRSIPFKIFVKSFFDLGYVDNSKNAMRLVNDYQKRLLYTGGIGIDILSIYDVVFRIEYGFNQFGRNGMYVHANDF